MDLNREKKTVDTAKQLASLGIVSSQRVEKTKKIVKKRIIKAERSGQVIVVDGASSHSLSKNTGLVFIIRILIDVYVTAMIWFGRRLVSLAITIQYSLQFFLAIRIVLQFVALLNLVGKQWIIFTFR